VVDDYRRLPSTDLEHVVRADHDGFVALEAGAIGRAGVLLGAGRARMEDHVNPAVGFEIVARHGTAVRAGDAVVIVRHDGSTRLDAALQVLAEGVRIRESAPSVRPLVLERILNG
jgi:thymidine phosphorylase